MRLLLTLATLVAPFILSSQGPNFVLILADDMGWNGTSVQISPTEAGSKSDFYETTSIETLAAEGMTFSQAYAPAAKCSPTRCSILTGESTARNSFTETGNNIETGKILIEASTNTSINSSDVTLAEWLKTLGLNYRTAHYGKWHLGTGGTSNHGFDFGDGNTNNNDGDAGDGNVIQTDPKKITDLTNKGIAFIQQAVMDNVPFYLQISHYAVHTLNETTQASFDHFTAKTPGTVHDNIPYAGMTMDMDASIDLIRQEIINQGIENNTYLIFTSDNGAGNGQSNNTPLKRGKAFIYEGGIRVPMIVKGPGIPANSHSSEPVTGYDFFPTIAEWTGSSVALPSTLDGQSIASILTQGSFTRNTPLFFHIPHYGSNINNTPRSAVVDGNFKLIVEYETGVDCLHNLSTDIGEATNIASSNPTIVEDMKVKLRDHLKAVGANMPSLDPAHANFSGTAPDVDSDGLTDSWEFTELLSYTYGPTDDPDGDGDDNLTEMNNGTDPLVNEVALASDDIGDLNAQIYNSNQIRLQWRNQVTDGISFYEVERSANATDWVKLSETSSNTTNYIDKTPLIGLNYYRLKIHYDNFETDYSDITHLWYEVEKAVSIFPNPSNGTLNIKLDYIKYLSSNISLQIFDQNGQIVRNFESTAQPILTFSLGGLLNGIYALRIFDNGELVKTERLVFLR